MLSGVKLRAFAKLVRQKAPTERLVAGTYADSATTFASVFPDEFVVIQAPHFCM